MTDFETLVHSRKLFAATASLLAASVVIGGSIVQAAPKRKASLKISAPHQVKIGQGGRTFQIKISGYSGRFEHLVYAIPTVNWSKCDTSNSKLFVFYGYFKRLKKNHTFVFRQTYNLKPVSDGGQVGKQYVCAWLRHVGGYKRGKYFFHRIKAITIVP